MNNPRLESLIVGADGADRTENVTSMPKRLFLENSGCYATRDEENDAIHVFAKDDTELYALSAKVIPYESRPLFLTFQIYLMGHNNGRVTMQQELRAKVEKVVELLKICV